MKYSVTILLFVIINFGCSTNSTKYIELTGNVIDSKIKIRTFENHISKQTDQIKYQFRTESGQYVFIQKNANFTLTLDAQDLGELQQSSRIYTINGVKYIVHKLLKNTRVFDSSVIYYLLEGFGIISIENDTWGTGILLYDGPFEIRVAATILYKDIEFRSEHWDDYNVVPLAPTID